MARDSRHLDVIVHFFDAIAPEYEDWAGGLHHRVAGRLVEVIAPRPGEHCLDVGCGTGLVANAVGRLVGDGGQVVGLDVSARMLDVARGHAPPNTLFQRISADPELQFPEGSFDLVTFGDSISYLGNPGAALGEARRVLRPGGRIGLSVRRRSLDTPAQEVFYGLLDEVVQRHPFEIPRRRDQRSLLGEPAILRSDLLHAGFEEPSITTMATGARLPTARAWVDLMEKSGPRPYIYLTSLGRDSRRKLESTIDREMRRLGEEAFHYHEAFTFAVATTS
jgi:demethylmenaquinone methyltransferase/2-methoxy-6-polyprenyl-1,4-benzoquinol methylase